MTAFQGAVDATFTAFGIDAVYTPAVGDPVGVRVRRMTSGDVLKYRKGLRFLILPG